MGSWLRFSRTSHNVASSTTPSSTGCESSGAHRNFPACAAGSSISRATESAGPASGSTSRATPIANVLLGVPLACAHCHDHKFDPITKCDYYGFVHRLRSSRDYGDLRELFWLDPVRFVNSSGRCLTVWPSRTEGGLYLEKLTPGANWGGRPLEAVETFSSHSVVLRSGPFTLCLFGLASCELQDQEHNGRSATENREDRHQPVEKGHR